MVISAFSFTEVARRTAPLMRPGGSLLTLTFGGATRVMPNYNAMGVAKAALEASVRYLAADYGTPMACGSTPSPPARSVRSPAPASPTPGRCSPSSEPTRRCAAASRSTTWAGAALYLLSDLAAGVTGEIHFVDAGYNTIAMPHPDRLRTGAGNGLVD